MGFAQQALDEAGVNTKVESAGVSPEFASQGGVTDKSVIAAKPYSIDISSHVSRYAGDLDLPEFDLFLTSGEDINQSLLTLGGSLEKIMTVGGKEGVPNPYQKDQSAYDECAKAVKEWIEENLQDIIARLS
jgi:protein-tyrosine-phosphatase